MGIVQELTGSRNASGCRFAIVVSRFNEDITTGLLKGARTLLAEAGAADDDLTLVQVPGAWEIPVVSQRLAETGLFDAIVCLGCLIKGDTMHFEYIADAVSQGIARAAAATGVPMAFGVLTTDSLEQATARSGSGPDNKGREAAAAAIEMAALYKTMASAAPRPFGFRA